MNKTIVIRTPSGLSGDMLITGLSRIARINDGELSAMVDAIGLHQLQDVLTIKQHNVNHISGFKAYIDLPHEHHHRTLKSIKKIIADSNLTDNAKKLATETFIYLGQAESKIHDIPLDDVAFHEVGALDSILDICLASALFAKIAPKNLYCSPIPICDGVIICEHGPLASPAPAVQEMLKGVPVYGIDSSGETITPTAIAFLRAANAQFGKWPAINITEVARVYGGKIIPNIPNGAMFFLGHD